MDEVLYYKAYVEELKAANEKLEEDNIKLREERDKLEYKLEDAIADMKEALWQLRREIDEKISCVIEDLEDIEL